MIYKGLNTIFNIKINKKFTFFKAILKNVKIYLIKLLASD